MYYTVNMLYQQWSHGQTPHQCAMRREDFIKLVCLHLACDPMILRQFLDSQKWFPKAIDNNIEQ